MTSAESVHGLSMVTVYEPQTSWINGETASAARKKTVSVAVSKILPSSYTLMHQKYCPLAVKDSLRYNVSRLLLTIFKT